MQPHLKKCFEGIASLTFDDKLIIHGMISVEGEKVPFGETLDPQAANGRSPSKRGIGLSFGPDVIANFLKNNGLSLIVRSHEVKEEGYEVEADGKLVTVFSAPNYCDQMGNKAAVMHLDHEGDYTVTQFEAVPHPPIRPMAYSSGMGGMFGF